MMVEKLYAWLKVVLLVVTILLLLNILLLVRALPTENILAHTLKDDCPNRDGRFVYNSGEMFDTRTGALYSYETDGYTGPDPWVKYLTLPEN